MVDRYQLDQGFRLSDDVRVDTQGGQVIFGDNVFVGTGSVIVCRSRVEVGSDSLIAEYVVIRDQDHRTDTRPLSSAGFYTSPIRIGRDVWIGCKASILRGAIRWRSLRDWCACIGQVASTRRHACGRSSRSFGETFGR